MELHAAGVLAALAATVLAAQCTADRRRLGVLFAVFVAVASLFAWARILDIEALAYCIAAAHAAAFLQPRWWLLPPIGGGIAAAGWVSILRAQGLPWLPAALAAAALLVATISLVRRRPAFMSEDVRDEALILVGVSALALATGPDIVDGWRSGLTLMAEPLAASGSSVGPWLGALVGASVVLGGAYTAWKRR